MRPYWFGAAVAIAIAAPAAQPGDACDGSFSVAGATTKLTSVYASIDRVFSEPGKDHLRVVLSDAPLPAAAAADDFALQKLTRDRKLHAVVLIISPAKQVKSTMLFDAAFNMDSVSSAGTNNQFEAATFTKDRVAGEAFTKEAREFRGVPYEYRAKFDAAIHR
jgi:hypothetical protein